MTRSDLGRTALVVVFPPGDPAAARHLGDHIGARRHEFAALGVKLLVVDSRLAADHATAGGAAGDMGLPLSFAATVSPVAAGPLTAPQPATPHADNSPGNAAASTPAGPPGDSLLIVPDDDGQLRRAFGIETRTASSPVADDRGVTFVFGSQGRLVRVYPASEPGGHAAELLADFAADLASDPPRVMNLHAPVLVVPHVFEPSLCDELIAVWHAEGNVDSGFMVQEGDRTVGRTDYGHKIRRDHFITNGPLKERIKDRLGRRVCPLIRQAFQYEATRFEDFRIACYDAERGGYFRPHRDNTTAGTAHRRFAISVNLNTGQYEGGFLRFPEFGRHEYRPATGGAVVFSCSLVHEATDITAGRRFVLLSFFYGEREARAREEYERRMGGNYRARG